MPVKIIADYRELLVDIFFAIIITVGFEKFLHVFFLENIFKINSFELMSVVDIFSDPAVAFNTLVFFATYFWVISHWVFYHELIEKYPYYNYKKFFVDIALFSLLFVIINMSFSAYNGINANLFVFLLVTWYSIATLWHLSDRGLRPLKAYIIPHLERILCYSILLALLYDPLSLEEAIPWYRHFVMICVIVAMISWNVFRLTEFLRRDIREYTCNYKTGDPTRSSRPNIGTLTLKKYPIKKKFGKEPVNERQNLIKFKSNTYSDVITILAKNLIDVNLVTNETESSANRGMIEIDYRDKNEKIIKIVLELQNELIEGVEKGINDLQSRNKKFKMLDKFFYYLI
jgi:hypothetical protein